MLSNINYNKLKEKTKIYKNKIKKDVITLGLSLMLIPSFTGCNKEDNIEISTIELENDDVKTQDINSDSIDKNIKQKTKEEICEDYSSFFKQYKIDYNLEEYLITEEEINNILTMSQLNKKCEYVSNYSSSDLIETIKNNSFDYLSKNVNYQSTFIEHTYGDDEYDKELYTDQLSFEIFLNKAINKFLEKATNDVNEDIHKMQTLKFVYGEMSQESNTATLGYYDEKENLIVLNRDCIDLVAILYDTKPEYVLYSTIQHELNHVRQHKCDCRITKENSYNRISYDGVSISSIIESSAESEIYNLDKQLSFIRKATYEYSYSEERKNESLLFLLALFNEGADIEDYYNSIFDVDWNSLLNFFNLKTEEEKYIFFKLLYIMDASKCRNKLPFSYYTTEEIENGITLQQLQYELGYDYKTEIFRICLNNLINYTKTHEDFQFIDNLLMFNIIKNKIVDGSYKIEIDADGNNNHLYDETSVSEILKLENKFVEFLSEYYRIDVEEIRKIEDSEIYWYGYCVTNLSVGKTTVYSKGYDRYSQKLLERFPILKSVLYTDYCYAESYKNFIKENDVKQKKFILN